MKKQIIFSVLFLLELSLGGQVFETFSAGHHFLEKGWEGDTAQFRYGISGLESNSWTENHQFVLAGRRSIPQKREWRFRLELKFNPSGLNYVEVYLQSDSWPGKGRHGWLVRIGGTKDEISLYEQKAGRMEERISGLDGRLNQSLNDVEVRVRCLPPGNWTLEIKDKEGKWVAEGVFLDTSGWVKFDWYGFLVRQSTPSFFGKHTFKYWYVGDTVREIQKPVRRGPRPGELIMTEIMSKPIEQVGSAYPGLEYVEILNIGSDTLNLEGVVLRDVSTAAKIGKAEINPGEYVVLSKDDKGWEKETRAIKLNGMPGLNDGEDELELRDKEGKLLHSVHYQSNWFGFTGVVAGKSLERGNEVWEEYEEGNWGMHQGGEGGSPGRPNTINQRRMEEANIWGEVDGLGRWTLVSDGWVDSGFMAGRKMLRADGAWLKVLWVHQKEARIISERGPDWEMGKPYEVTIDTWKWRGGKIQEHVNVVGCAGLLAKRGQLVVCEVLFDPLGDRGSFVEVYNRSQSCIKMAGLQWEWWVDGELKKAHILGGSGALLPGRYYCFSSDTSSLGKHYSRVGKSGWIFRESLPELYRSGGTIILRNEEGEIIDSMSYDAKMHAVWIAQTKGIALERLCLTCDISDWASAGFEARGATPGYANSQQSEWKEKESKVWTYQTRITPDGDGVEDDWEVQYDWKGSEVRMDMMLFDRYGNLLGILEEGWIAGSNGVWRWDGTLGGVKCEKGIYIVGIEGKALSMRRYRSRFVVSLL